MTIKQYKNKAVNKYSNKTISMSDDRISYLKRQIDENWIRPKDAREALELHLSQLQRLGATLEDSVCGILRKVIARSEAEEELERLTDGTWRE